MQYFFILLSCYLPCVCSLSSRDVSDWTWLCADGAYWSAQLIITVGVGSTQQEMAHTCVGLCDFPLQLQSGSDHNGQKACQLQPLSQSHTLLGFDCFSQFLEFLELVFMNWQCRPRASSYIQRQIRTMGTRSMENGNCKISHCKSNP